MQTASFHRKIFPWIFVIAFLAIAPAVVFYTAGYRWNPKKGKIERGSTAIIDSMPKAATVSIDGQLTTYETPITITNILPGSHHIRVAKEGYTTWSKTLEVESERVLFANAIRLWLQADPLLRYTENVIATSVSPDEDHLLRVTNGTTTRLLLTDLSTQRRSDISLAHVLLTPIRVFWSFNGRYALVESGELPNSSLLVDTLLASQPLELPIGTYRWERNELIGNDGKTRISISFPGFSLTRSPFPAGIVDQTIGADLRVDAKADGLVYVAGDRDDRGLVLPPGNWTFWATFGSTVVLRDGTDWLSFESRDDEPEYRMAQGDTLRTAPGASSLPRQLLIRGSELWTWNPGSNPELLYRQSGRITAATWHTEGNDIFFATDNTVFALNLDTRDGRILTPLATFERIDDLTRLKKALLITGKKNSQNGVWELPLE